MTTVYVDQSTGADGSAGTAAAPLASVGAALAALEATGQPGTVVVEGTYYVSSPLELTSANDGDTLTGGTLVAATAAEAVDLSDASDVTVTATTIVAPDGDGVLVDGGSGNTVSYSIISNSGIAGVEIKNQAADTTVVGNTILASGSMESNPTSGGAVYVHGASNTDILSNLVDQTAAAGISLSDFNGDANGYSTEIEGATVEGNLLLDVGTAGTSDYGAIYVLGRGDNLQDVTIADNTIEGVDEAGTGSLAQGIYLDDRASGDTVTGNVVEGLDSTSHAVQLHGGSDDVVNGNTFDMGNDPQSAFLVQQPPTNVAQAPGAADPFVDTTLTDNTVTRTGSVPTTEDFYLDGTLDGGPALPTSFSYGPDALTATLVNTTDVAQSVSLLVGTNAGWYPNLQSSYTVAAEGTLEINRTGTFDVNGQTPFPTFFDDEAGALQLTSLTNDGFVNPGQALPGGPLFAQDFAPPNVTPVTLGSGPDEIVLSLTGLDDYTQYEVQIDAAAGAAAQQFNPLDTSATGSVSQQVTIYGTFTAGEDPQLQIDALQGAYGEYYTGNESTEDPNAGVVVQSIAYDGVTVTPNATITGTEFSQTFTVDPPAGLSMTQYAAPATSGPLAAPLVVDDANDLGTQLGGFLSAYDAGDAKVLFMGDSVTAGVGSDPSNSSETAGSYPDEVTYWLNQDGVSAQVASVEDTNSNGVTQVGTTTDGDPIYVSGQTTLEEGASLNSAYSITGDTPLLYGAGSQEIVNFDDPITANQLQIELMGQGGSPVTVSANGSVVSTLTPSSDNLFDDDTVNLSSSEIVNSVTLTETGNGGQYVESVQAVDTASPAIRVLNAGVSGGTADGTNYQESVGSFSAGANNAVPNVIAQDPNLVFIDYGINDMNYGESVDTFIGAVGSIVADLRAANVDVVLMSPTPFTDQNGQSQEASVVSALGSLAVADGVPFLDLNDTYGGSSAANVGSLAAAGFFSTYGAPHLSATAYANVGQQIGSFVASAVHAYA